MTRPWDMSGFVVYTTQTGGIYKAARATREEYEEAVKTGRWQVYAGSDDGPHCVDLKMIGFLACEEYHDFVLGESFVP